MRLRTFTRFPFTKLHAVYRLSSNATLFLKIFLPAFWTTIMLGITLVTWFAPEHYFGGVPLESLRWATLFTLVVGVVSFWILLWPLKRVETDGQKVYVSNYFRTAFYDWERDVEALHESNFLFFKVGTLELNGVGSFGRKMRFLVSRRLLKEFKEAAPGVIPE
ncbi:hypothetical protein [Lewinella sp. W8]|uniref:hypothetical protein n=1 Tax=Lewinella sp. W8 TaxID=2528208 RepID=UPI0010683AD6|nr:hypothetical protein [Lewinella sp. W8]MTB53206.1 hypothetical protein [Lewinella sp. W8]